MPRPVVPTLPPPSRASLPDVERHVVRHDHVRAAADPDARDVDAARGEHVELVDEGQRVDHDPVADDRGDVRIEHARRRQPELEDLVAVDHRVAGVVAALVAHDHRDLLGQEVGRLALALVAPLQPDDHGGRHQRRQAWRVVEPRIGALGGRGEGGRRAKERAHPKVRERLAEPTNARPGRPARRLKIRRPRPAGSGLWIDCSRCCGRPVARTPHGTADAP